MSFKSTFFSLIFFFWFITVLVKAQANRKVFNVKDYGAVADGKTDNTKALSSAWNAACQFNGDSVLLIPRHTYMIGRVVLEGPCKGSLDFELRGVLKAPEDLTSFHGEPWMSIRHVNKLTVSGGGTLDGQGAKAWKKCHVNKDCDHRPWVSLNFDFINNSRIHDITSINSKRVHFKIFGSKDVTLHHLTIRAPGQTSVNTDGIYIAKSNNVQVLDTNISTGDDCIALGPGAKNINITNINCGPGHGISIGSLGGRGPNEPGVDSVRVFNCTFTRSTNGVRIKTWASPNPSTVSNINFEHLQMVDVFNPIIIDQHYCPSRKCMQGESNVDIHDVGYKNIFGTSSSRAAVTLHCSKIKPCKNIQFADLNLNFKYPRKGTVSSCSNVRVITKGKIAPPLCV